MGPIFFFSFTMPDGNVVEFRFVADEFGYRVESPLLPVGPEMPAHALEQIRHAEEERAQGISHGGEWDPERYA